MDENTLFNEIETIYGYEKKVFNSTLEAFKMLYKTAKKIEEQYNEHNHDLQIELNCDKNGEYEFEITVGSDIIVFMLHPNVFEFPRAHEIMKLPYVTENKLRSQCGTILIYNYIADSIKYRRINDIGYLIGRLFVNQEKHFYVEGKKEIGMFINRYGVNVLNENYAKDILESAIQYVMHFGLLVPDYDMYKELPVDQFLQYRDYMQIKTAKRLGFRFQADKEL
ncbi:MAG: hypothetical protein PHU62_05950 [Bacteroidales bacterium]|jgi:hypothetical protein|nr:hypothetical protein [Bacteroidales bacterium]MDD2204821.1 hypothetical protein [Bacteroidales bacterium]MDD3152620.1 hypothetical protein [Bacteroidales bacterium]MDD3914353.1 hypothetical protein [Bacteroidales bacterium]MDD4634098.1 hypothetical protein [Bacteroidales bacterium]